MRVHIYWAQVEPEPGRYDWQVMGALLDQAMDVFGAPQEIEVWDSTVWLSISVTPIFISAEVLNREAQVSGTPLA